MLDSGSKYRTSGFLFAWGEGWEKAGEYLLLSGRMQLATADLVLASLPFFYGQGEIPNGKSDSVGFTYKEQYAVVVICKDEDEQEQIYSRLKAEGFELKVVAV